MQICNILAVIILDTIAILLYGKMSQSFGLFIMQLPHLLCEKGALLTFPKYLAMTF